jgi:hypothetical protein
VPQPKICGYLSLSAWVRRKAAMKVLVMIAVLAGGAVFAGGAQADPAETLCAQNPAFAADLMEKVIRGQLEADHDPSLDADTPEHLAQQASAQGIAECAAEMRRDPSVAAAFASAGPNDMQVAWDAFNTACADHAASRGACISAEINSSKALRRMIATDQPDGAKALVQTCELVMQADPPLAEWRECVDQALAVHASGSTAKRCKLAATWHVAKSGAQAGALVAACLRGG